MNRKTRVLILMIIDVILINLAYFVSVLLLNKFSFPEEYINMFTNYIIVSTVIKISLYAIFKLYTSLWKYAGVDELLQVFISVIISNSIIKVIFSSIPISMLVLLIMLELIFIGGLRLSYRTLHRIKNGIIFTNVKVKRVMIVGAGNAGSIVIRELKNHSELNSKPIVVIDDNILKIGTRINGVPVLGQRKDILDIAKKKEIDEIIITIPSANKKDLKSILDECKKTDCKVKTLPGIYEMINGNISLNQLRDVEITDLLGREEINLNIEEISHYVKDKRVLVTGGGGSIGSELCRQIAKFKPDELAILDIYENNAYDVQNELKRKHSLLNLKVFIASVRDKDRMDEIVKDYKPDVIFHAAAHKHVPLMEDNPKEAIKNNVFGTLNLVQAADKHKVNKFVLISTDKAVNPTNIMGASKRVCEMIVQSIDKISNTEFVAVRFGNVLGSNGSVIPLFKKQIAEGGPVTVTHQDVIRYFMTIPEASQLVIQAGAMAQGGEIFVLDMGEPVKIIDLAKDLIKLSGYEPDVDMKIEITGLRPGEKLYEELLMDEEGIKSTKFKKIHIGKPINIDYKILLKSLDELRNVINNGTNNEVKDLVSQIVPTYKNNKEVNEIFKEQKLKEVSVTAE